jgi:hypothetical protein
MFWKLYIYYIYVCDYVIRETQLIDKTFLPLPVAIAGS